MQGTVRSFDPARRCGAVLLDDGAVLDFDAAAFGGSGLRLLRPGQRVRLDVDRTGDGGGPRVRRLTILTLP